MLLVRKFYAEIWIVLLSWLSTEEKRTTGELFEWMNFYGGKLDFACDRPRSIAKVLYSILDLELIEVGDTSQRYNAQRWWRLSADAHSLVMLVRGALHPEVKMTPPDHTRLDLYNCRPMSYGRLCRGVERIVVLGLLDSGMLTKRQVVNGLGWICGPSFDQSRLSKDYLTPLSQRGFVVVEKRRGVVLTPSGKAYLELLRKAIRRREEEVCAEIAGWHSVLGHLDQVPLGRESNNFQEVSSG